MKAFLIFLFLFFAEINGLISSIDLKCTEEGYWYAKLYNNDPQFSDGIIFDGLNDLQSLSLAELWCFLESKLRENNPAFEKLNFWNYVKQNDLELSDEEKSAIEKDLKILQKDINRHKDLLEQIAGFYGIKKRIRILGFYSRTSQNSTSAGGSFLGNFICGDEICSIFLMCEPPLNMKMSLGSRLGVIGHEFSHAMLDCAFGSRENFEKTVAQINEPHAKIVSWFLNEALAAVLGNIIVQEKISGEKVDWEAEEYCTYGFANALRPITEKYLKNSRSIDSSYIREAIKIFNKLFPNCDREPRFFLRRFHLMADGDGEKEISFLGRQIPFDFWTFTSFQNKKLHKQDIHEIMNSDTNLVVVYSDPKQLKKIRKFLPRFDRKRYLNVIHKKRKTYLIIKIDKTHSFEQIMDELFS